MADKFILCQEKTYNLLGDIYGLFQNGGMKRYRFLVNSLCLQCDKWLCVMSGTYTGEIVCGKCGAVNVFRDSSQPSDAYPVTAAPSSQLGTFVSSE